MAAASLYYRKRIYIHLLPQGAAAMLHKTVSAADFEKNCLRLIDEVIESDGSVTVLREGIPVVRLTTVAPEQPPAPFLGFLEGTVLRYDEPFEPAVPPEEWDAVRDPA
jgi:antitoxin (DNA-binding transcriptional repressor) of toxin-antitoxin stability system